MPLGGYIISNVVILFVFYYLHGGMFTFFLSSFVKRIQNDVKDDVTRVTRNDLEYHLNWKKFKWNPANEAEFNPSPDPINKPNTKQHKMLNIQLNTVACPTYPKMSE